MAKRVLVLGSGPNAVDCVDWDLSGFDAIVAINNAWQVRRDWTHLIHPEDFPEERRPKAISSDQTIVTAADYVPCQNNWGGFVYAGGTMAFTAGYWALDAMRPEVMAFLGCDMVYSSSGNTHFYGTGAADPLREDITLQSLEAKSARLMLLAAGAGCACVNLSSASHSRLVFPRASVASSDQSWGQARERHGQVEEVLRQEERLGYSVPSGRYWQELDRFDPAELRKLDAAWLEAMKEPALA